MENCQKLNISVIGLEPTEQRVLQVAAGMLSVDDINCNLLDGLNLNGEIVVLDIDTETGAAHFPQLRESQVKIILSNSRSVSGKNILTLRKPIRVTSLKEILAQICTQIFEYLARQQGQLSKTTPPSPPAADTQTANPDTPSGNIFQRMHHAKTSGQCLKISADGLPDIYVNGVSKTVFTTGSQTTFTKYYERPNEELGFQRIEEDALAESVKNLTPHALDMELWQAGVTCSRGILLPGHSSDTPVKLTAWPNFTRQGFKPDFFKVAAAMAKQAISIDDVSKTTHVQLDIVIDFYNAAFAVDLISTKSSDANKTQPERQMSTERKSLLGKLAQRLKFA